MELLFFYRIQEKNIGARIYKNLEKTNFLFESPLPTAVYTGRAQHALEFYILPQTGAFFSIRTKARVPLPTAPCIRRPAHARENNFENQSVSPTDRGSLFLNKIPFNQASGIQIE